MPLPHIDSEFGKKVHALAEKKADDLPKIDKKSDVGRYLYNFGWVQCLSHPWYAGHYKFWGRPSTSFLKSFSVKMSALVFFISMFLIIVPQSGLIVVPYPISTTQNIEFSGGQTINFNQFYSKTVFLSKGNTISYRVAGNQPFSFAIWDKPFENFQTTGKYYTESTSFYVNMMSGDVKNVSIYLHKGDSIIYGIHSTVNDPQKTEFYITNSLNYDQPKYVDTELGQTLNGTFVSPKSQVYYLGYSYSGGTLYSRALFKTTLQYNVTSANLNTAFIQDIGTKSVNQSTFTVPESGYYRFYIYSDPMLKVGSTNIGLEITFTQHLNNNDNWIQLSQYFTTLSFLMIALIIFTKFQHIYARRFEKAKKIYYSDFSLNRACFICRELVRPQNVTCPYCGAPLKDEA